MNIKIPTQSLTIALLALVSIGCQKNLSNDSAYTQVTNEYINVLIERKLDHKGNFISLSNDGTFSGTWKNSPIAGNWEMKDDYFCRVLTVFHDQSALNKEDCQLWEINENRLRGTRDKGNGDSFIYKVSS